jgi:hypothetical protein
MNGILAITFYGQPPITFKAQTSRMTIVQNSVEAGVGLAIDGRTQLITISNKIKKVQVTSFFLLIFF